jgi:hypothetical protein
MEYVERLQSVLDLEFLMESNPSFGKKGLGAMGIGGIFVGLIAGINITIVTFLALAILFGYIIPTALVYSVLIWCIYLSLLSVFHALEFLVTAMKQPTNISYDSFIINHSSQYTMAFLASLAEYWIETLIFGSFKQSFFSLKVIGLVFMVTGQSVRSLAMW